MELSGRELLALQRVVGPPQVRQSDLCFAEVRDLGFIFFPFGGV